MNAKNPYAAPNVPHAIVDEPVAVSSRGWGVRLGTILPTVCVGCGTAEGVTSVSGLLRRTRMWLVPIVMVIELLLTPFVDQLDDEVFEMMHLASFVPFGFGAILLTQTTLDLKMPFCHSCGRRQTIGGTLIRVVALAMIPYGPLVTFILYHWSSFEPLDAGAIGSMAAMGLGLLGAFAGGWIMKVRQYRWDGTYVWFPRLPAATSAAWEKVNHSPANAAGE